MLKHNYFKKKVLPDNEEVIKNHKVHITDYKKLTLKGYKKKPKRDKHVLVSKSVDKCLKIFRKRRKAPVSKWSEVDDVKFKESE